MKENLVDKTYKELYKSSEKFRNLSLDRQGEIAMDLGKIQEWENRKNKKKLPLLIVLFKMVARMIKRQVKENE